MRAAPSPIIVRFQSAAATMPKHARLHHAIIGAVGSDFETQTEVGNPSVQRHWPLAATCYEGSAVARRRRASVSSTVGLAPRDTKISRAS